MTISLQAFINKYDEKKVGTGQCVAMVQQLIREVWGISNPDLVSYGNAIDWYHNSNNARVRRVRNTPTGVPPVGALVILNHKVDGHIFVVRPTPKSTVHLMYSFDQNWSDPLHCEPEAHAYSECVGWLIKK